MSNLPTELQQQAERMRLARERAEQLRAQYPDKTFGQIVIKALRENNA
jgi:hypothetical protein